MKGKRKGEEKKTKKEGGDEGFLILASGLGSR